MKSIDHSQSCTTTYGVGKWLFCYFTFASIYDRMISKEVGNDVSVVSRNNQSKVSLPTPPKRTSSFIHDTLCAIWCHLYNFKKVKSTHWGVLLVVKFQAEVKFLHGCFSRFLNCTNDNKSRKACRIKFHSKKCRVGESNLLLWK